MNDEIIVHETANHRENIPQGCKTILLGPQSEAKKLSKLDHSLQQNYGAVTAGALVSDVIKEWESLLCHKFSV